VAEQSKTVDAALRLLALLGDGGGPGGEGPGAEGTAAAFARRLHLSRTAVGRILATLEAHGLARRTPAGGWDMGLGVLTLATRIEPVLRAAARPRLEELVAAFGETAVLALRDGTEVVAVDQVVATRRMVQVRYRPGTRHAVERAAHGRALLPEGLAAGFVVSEGELEPGVRGVAAAVHATAEGEPVASIGVVAPSGRFPPEAEVIGAVRAAALAVTLELTRPASPRGGEVDAVLPASR
jgi:DNA-binding IclR family transcriptional regulator